MIKSNLLIVALSATTIAQSQEVVSSSGNSLSNSNGTIDYTVGEVITATHSNSSTITQGFHQTNWSLAGIEDQTPNVEVILYPNPVSTILNIETSAFNNTTYELFDATGKIVRKGNLNGLTTQIDVHGIEPGPYNLRLSNNDNSILKTYKLIKHN